MTDNSSWRRLSAGWLILAVSAVVLCQCVDAIALQIEPPPAAAPEGPPDRGLDLLSLLKAGGALGYLIVLLSLIMVALIADHVMNIRRTTLMPPGLAEEVHRCLAERDAAGAKKRCDEYPGFLSRLLGAGLDEVGVGYTAVEKAMEDAAVEQSARLFRRIEYLSVIATVAPMLGLMGTVWGDDSGVSGI